jgi:hypothetical protein
MRSPENVYKLRTQSLRIGAYEYVVEDGSVDGGHYKQAALLHPCV